MKVIEQKLLASKINLKNFCILISYIFILF